LGKRKPLFLDWSIPFPPEWGDGDHLTLRELITRIVLDEFTAFKERQEERRLARALSVVQIGQAMECGKVDSGGRKLDQDVEEEVAVATALQAFEDGLYLVVVDDEEQRNLDA